MLNEQRTTLRRQILSKRDQLSPEDLTERSLAITVRLLDLPHLTNAPVVLVYMHFRSEVRTDALIRALLAKGNTVCIPLTLPAQRRLQAVRISDPDQDVAPGYQGILEPRSHLLASEGVTPGEIRAVIVPGSVFDPGGGRLGYGGGYYDRFLALDAPEAVRIGAAFELQLVPKVPAEPHDQLMDWVVTENNCYDCRRIRHAQDSGIPR